VSVQENIIRGDSVKDLKQAYNAAPKKAVLFYHIHKTGGSTLKAALSQHFGDAHAHVSTPQDVETFKAKVEDGWLDQFDNLFIQGHRVKDIAHLVQQRRPVFGLTVLRRPTEVFASQYSFQHYRHARHDLTATDFITETPPNPMLKHLGYKTYDAAMSGISDQLSFIGMTSELEKSIAILNHIFSMADYSSEAINKVPAADYAELPEDMLSEIYAFNKEDNLFFDHLLTRHQKLWRRAEAELGLKPKSLMETDASFALKPELNYNLEANGNKVSLFLTGIELFSRRPKQALAFFDKAVDLDWGMLVRISKALEDTNSGVARKWVEARVTQLETINSPYAQSMSNRMRQQMREHAARNRREQA
jgi:hypothetical protein